MYIGYPLTVNLYKLKTSRFRYDINNVTFKQFLKCFLNYLDLHLVNLNNKLLDKFLFIQYNQIIKLMVERQTRWLTKVRRRSQVRIRLCTNLYQYRKRKNDELRGKLAPSIFECRNYTRCLKPIKAVQNHIKFVPKP